MEAGETVSYEQGFEDGREAGTRFGFLAGMFVGATLSGLFCILVGAFFP